MTIHEILKEYWGYDEFRPMQEDIIQSVMDGKDSLALLPTGGGKSICFQVPALAMEGICLVVSPLIALMKDQVSNLVSKGVPALSIHSGMNYFEVKQTLQNAAHGNYKFLYVSPERLETNAFLEFLPGMNICLLAIDEAHCISQWGYDFRPSYCRIAALRTQLPGVPVLALTASATATVQDDICEKLLFGKTQQRFLQSFERPNLSYSVFENATKQNKLVEILKNVPGTSIVYCRNRKHTKDIKDWLLMNKLNADHYHAGLSNDERNKKQEDWISGRTRVIVSTNAFGMGIDKPDVRTVIHYDVPDCLENYYQEAGRAGRDGKRSYAVLLFSKKELEELELQSEIRYPSPLVIKAVYTALMNHLQVAAGSGEGLSFDLDLGVFCSAFKLNVLAVSYVIKTLEQEQVLRFSELFFKPSTVIFTTDRSALVEFEKQHPELEPLIKGLLRSYEGIIDFPSTIFENSLAKFIREDLAIVKKGLRKLNNHGIIDYQQQKDKPQVTLLQNRMYADNYNINPKDYQLRKENFEKRVAAIGIYARLESGCRSIHIADYFNAASFKPCGICDNCIKIKGVQLTGEAFDRIAEQILDILNAGSCDHQSLFNSLKAINKEKLWKVLNFLIGEDKVSVNEWGMIESRINNARQGG